MVYLLVNLCSSRNELSRILNKHDVTVSFHLKKLLEMEIIEKAIVKPEDVYL